MKDVFPRGFRLENHFCVVDCMEQIGRPIRVAFPARSDAPPEHSHAEWESESSDADSASDVSAGPPECDLQDGSFYGLELFNLDV